MNHDDKATPKGRSGKGRGKGQLGPQRRPMCWVTVKSKSKAHTESNTRSESQDEQETKTNYANDDSSFTTPVLPKVAAPNSISTGIFH